jgi:hypothetical protein
MTMFEPEPVQERETRTRPLPAPAKRSIATSVVLAIAAIVAVGGISFAVGRVTAPVATRAATDTGGQGGFGAGGPTASRQPGQGFGGGAGAAGLGGFGGGGIRGTVTEITADHVALTLTNGTTITIPIDSKTTYHQQQSATVADITAGKSVLVETSRPTTTGTGGAGASPSASGGFRLGTASDITLLAP